MNPLLHLIEPARALYDLAQDGILVTDESGTIVYINDSFTELFGYEKNELLRNSCGMLVKNPGASFQDIIKDLLLNRSLLKKVSCIRSDGSALQAKVTFSLLLDSGEKPAGIIMIFHRKHLERQDEIDHLEAQSGLLRALNYRTGEMYTVSDVLNGQYLLISMSCEKILGWSQTELLEGGWAFFHSLVHPEDFKSIANIFLREINTRNTEKYIHDHEPIVYEYRFQHKDGSWRFLEAEGIILERNAAGMVRYMITFTRDITEEKLKQRQLSGQLLEDLLQVDLAALLDPEGGDVRESPDQVIHLSKREKEILLLVKEGNSSKQISDKLRLTESTVNTYRKNLMGKLNARNSAELVRICMEKKII